MKTLKRILKDRKHKKYEQAFYRKIGERVLNKIKHDLYYDFDTFATDFIDRNNLETTTEEDFENIVEMYYSDIWVEFLDSTGLELMYNIIPIKEQGTDNIVDFEIEILEV